VAAVVLTLTLRLDGVALRTGPPASALPDPDGGDAALARRVVGRVRALKSLGVVACLRTDRCGALRGRPHETTLMIVEFDIDSDVLSHALQRTPGMSVVVDTLDASDAIPLRHLFWAAGGDFDRFEAALEADPTITTFEHLAEESDARLYRLQYAAEVPEVEAYRALVDLDGAVLHAENDGQGWFVRLRFPSREAIAAFRERCWAVDFDIHIRAVYDRDQQAPEHRFGLTTAQHETLLTALKTGYFTIPRAASLQDVADDLDVSSQAASERLRRGMKSLVGATLADTEEREPVESIEVDR
jgi:hypothetical protein